MKSFILSFSSALTMQLVAQTGGVLTPPAAPGLTMKSLDQVEARTPVVDGAHGVSIDPTTGTITINQRGSYYLTDNVNVVDGNGINLNNNGITLDLNGFTISSSTADASNSAIEINGSSIRIFNGHIVSGVAYNAMADGDQFVGNGFDHGVYASTDIFQNLHVHDVAVLGCDFYGIALRNTETSLVERCSVRVVGGSGIVASVVRNSIVRDAGSTGIDADLVESSISYTYSSHGISCKTAIGCRALTRSTSISSDGINAQNIIQNCYGYAASGDGLDALLVYNSYGRSFSDSSVPAGIDAANLVDGSYGESNGGPGIEAFRVTNSYGSSRGSDSSSHGIVAGNSVFNSYGVSIAADGINAELVSYSKGRGSTSIISSDGIEADLAIGCRVDGGENITNKYLMP